MWLSQQSRRTGGETGPGVGLVTLAGTQPGIYLDGERRQTAVFGPAGYCWRPKVGQRVLVIKAGAEGELPCLVGAEQEPEEGLAPGEIALRGPGGGAVYLRGDGSVDLVGQVKVNGVPLEALLPPSTEEEGG